MVTGVLGMGGVRVGVNLHACAPHTLRFAVYFVTPYHKFTCWDARRRLDLTERKSSDWGSEGYFVVLCVSVCSVIMCQVVVQYQY